MPRGVRNDPIEYRFSLLYKINEQTDCWIWQGGTNNIGYGFIRDGKRMRTAHRVSFEIHNHQKIPKFMCVCHTCDNPLCVNPDHLWLGTRKQNYDDMVNKGRANSFGGKTRKGTKHKRLTCTHCQRDIAVNVFTRYHGDMCKHKPKE
jgi:HNH endonuclease